MEKEENINHITFDEDVHANSRIGRLETALKHVEEESEMYRKLYQDEVAKNNFIREIIKSISPILNNMSAEDLLMKLTE